MYYKTVYMQLVIIVHLMMKDSITYSMATRTLESLLFLETASISREEGDKNGHNNCVIVRLISK